MKPAQAAREIAAVTGVTLRPASREDVARLKALGGPTAVLDFFAMFEPEDCAEISGARLWPIAEIVRENSEFIPGADLHPRGFLVIGTTEFGGAYCVDLTGSSDRSQQVVLMSHELSWKEMSDSQVRALRKMVAGSFDEFLEHFVAGGLDQEPLFEPAG